MSRARLNRAGYPVAAAVLTALFLSPVGAGASWQPLLPVPPAGSFGPTAPPRPASRGGECVILDEVNERCPVWERRYDGQSYTGAFAGVDRATSVEVDPSGSRVYVTGKSWKDQAGGVPNAGDDFLTVAYDPETGEEAWIARSDGPLRGDDAPTDLAVSPNGSTVYVTGIANWGLAGPAGDIATVAYDAETGAQLWFAVHGGAGGGREIGWAVAPSPDGRRVYVTGEVDNSSTGRSQDLVVLAYEASSGLLKWSADFDGSSLDDRGWDLGVSFDSGTVFVTGWSETSGNGRDWVTLAYVGRDDDSPGGEGRLLWAVGTDGGYQGQDEPVALGVATDSSVVYVTGRAHRPGERSEFLTVAYDSASGETRWTARWSGDPLGEVGPEDYPASLVVTADGVFVAGSAVGRLPECAMATIGYDPDSGEEMWTGLYHLQVMDQCTYGRDIAASPDGRLLYVTGHAFGWYRTGPVNDPLERLTYVTVAYDAATGEQDWVARFNSSDQDLDGDWVESIAVAPDGARVFVTGSLHYQPPTPGAENTWDYLTISYET